MAANAGARTLTGFADAERHATGAERAVKTTGQPLYDLVRTC
jgi:hypothetical protein